jgi:GAF domain-containing protein
METPTRREQHLASTLVELADTLVDEFDVVELLTRLTQRCVELLDVTAAGLMLAADDGDLRVMASSSDATRVLELLEVQADEGPCIDCYRTGEPIVNQDLGLRDGRWPHFGAAARDAGFQSSHAIPMRLRGSTIGALNLFRQDRGLLGDGDVLVAQALADVATIAVLQHRAAQRAQHVNEQLQLALSSRIVIEQAKGVIAERAGLAIDDSFTLLRGHARRNNLKLSDVALDVVEGRLPMAALLPPP